MRGLWTTLLLIFCVHQVICVDLIGRTYEFTASLEPRVSLSWSIDREYIYVRLRVLTTGWVAFGFSPEGRMQHSDAYLGYNDNGVQSVTDYYLAAAKQACPGACPDEYQGGTDDVLGYNVTQIDGVTTMYFYRKLVTNDTECDVAITPDLKYGVYAFSPTGDDTVTYHSVNNRGRVRINYFTGHTSSLEDNKKVLVVHGVVMFAIWNVITPISVMFGRYFTPKKKAIRLHIFMQEFVIICSLAMTFLALSYASSHFATSHAILGIIFLVLCSIQGYLGNSLIFVFPFWKKTEGKRLPRSVRRIGSIIHPYMGRFLFVASFACVWTGMNLFTNFGWFHAIFWAWCGVITVFYLVLEIFKRFLRRLKDKKVPVNNKIEPGTESVNSAPGIVKQDAFSKPAPAEPNGASPTPESTPWRTPLYLKNTPLVGSSPQIGSAAATPVFTIPRLESLSPKMESGSPNMDGASIVPPAPPLQLKVLKELKAGTKTSSASLNSSSNSLLWGGSQGSDLSPRSMMRRSSLIHASPEMKGIIVTKSTSILVLSFSAIALAILVTGSAGVVYEGMYIYGKLPDLPTSPNDALRKYYIAAEEYEWNYVPSGFNNMTGFNFTATEALYAIPGPSLGPKYKKVRYVQYTDATFTTKRPLTPGLGMVGPILRAMVGDTLQVTFFNNASHPYSMHPHGVFYTKSNEGAEYNDGASSAGDSVAPGQTYNYIWPVTERAGPNASDPSSVFYMIHSHVNEQQDVNAGLVAGIIVTRADMANNKTRKPIDVDKEFVLFFSVIDENNSPYLSENIQTYGPTLDPTNSNFVEGNRKQSINGYMYGNIPGLNVTQGDRVRWYVATLGSFMDVHMPSWASHTMKDGTERSAGTRLLAGSAATLDMDAVAVGTWDILCHVTDHITKGMSALLTVYPKKGFQYVKQPSAEREYFIAAEEGVWNYAPSAINRMTNLPYKSTEAPFATKGQGRIGPSYVKARYVEYTDATFQTLKPVPPEWSHLGILGPVIRAEVGDNITVHFKNNARYGFNLIIDSFAAANGDAANRTLTSPNSTTTYKWYVGPNCAPTNKQASSILWTYSSIDGQNVDVSHGLIGPVIITQANQTNSTTGLPYGVDLEFVLLFTAFDENLSPYLALNVQTMSLNASSVTPSSMQSSNRKFSINGYIYGNLPNLTMNVADRVRWYTFDMGAQGDYHTPLWYGNTVVYNQHRTEEAPLFPGLSITSDMVPDNNGTFIVDCHMLDHMANGMQALYKVVSSQDIAPPAVTGKTRYYYIAADEVEWDYVPLGWNEVMGRNFTGSEIAITQRSNTTVGSKYLKALYREYTDATFTVLVNRSADPDWQHMGQMGPAIRAVVGDKLVVTFKNNARFNFSMSPTGVLALPSDNSGGASVAPNAIFTYTWYVPERSGPTAEDSSSIMWFYRSTVNEVKDAPTGLYGPIVISRSLSLTHPPERETVPDDVDREFFLTITSIDESASQYHPINLATYLPPGAKPSQSFRLQAVNGYLFGNVPGLAMEVGERVRWYSFVLGGGGDIHTAHWHGQTLIWNGRRLDVQTLQPHSLTTLDMVPDNVGTWLFHCHLNAHIDGGMTALFTVAPSSEEDES